MLMKWFSMFSYRTFYYRSILALVVGVIALFVPNDTLQFLVRLIGGFVLLAGVGTFVAVYRSDKNLLFSLGGTAAIVSMVIGVCLIARPDFFIKMIVSFLGIMMIIVGFLQIVNGVNMRGEIAHAKFYIGAGLIPLLVGLVFLFFSKEIESLIGLVLGITLIIYALSEIGLGFKMRRYFNAEAKVEDVDFVEIEE